MNLYSYVLNNPFRYLDPDGEFAIELSLTALYGAWSTGGLTAAAAVIGTAALPITLAVATGVAVGWAAYEINKSNPNLARNLLNIHATVSNGMYTPYYTFTPEMAKKAEKEKKNTNPFDGPVDEDVMIVDSAGNTIPVKEGNWVTGSKDGKWIQEKKPGSNIRGEQTGIRIDGRHPEGPKHPDPRGWKPHAHVPGITNPDGTPWLSIK